MPDAQELVQNNIYMYIMHKHKIFHFIITNERLNDACIKLKCRNTDAALFYQASTV